MSTKEQEKNPGNPEAMPERITVLSRAFPPAAMEFHRRNMARRGYRMEGRVTRRIFLLTDGLGEPEALFDGEPHYAVTFIRREGNE